MVLSSTELVGSCAHVHVLFPGLSAWKRSEATQAISVVGKVHDTVPDGSIHYIDGARSLLLLFFKLSQIPVRWNILVHADTIAPVHGVLYAEAWIQEKG